MVNLNIGAVATAVSPVEKESPLKMPKYGSLSFTSLEERKNSNENESTISIVVVGASGDLAKKKIFPALFALFYEDCLPEVWRISIFFMFGEFQLYLALVSNFQYHLLCFNVSIWHIAMSFAALHHIWLCSK